MNAIKKLQRAIKAKYLINEVIKDTCKINTLSRLRLN